MNEEINTSKNNSIKTILIVILALISVGSIGFIVYDKLINKEETKTEENNNEENSSINNSGESINNSNDSVIGTYSYITKVYDDERECLLVLYDDYTFYLKNEEYDHELEFKGVYSINNDIIELKNFEFTRSTSQDASIESFLHKPREDFEVDENAMIKSIRLNISGDSLVMDDITFIKQEEKYVLSDTSLDVDFDSYKIELDACLGCGSWEFRFENPQEAYLNNKKINFSEDIKYWAILYDNDGSSSNYLLLSEYGDLYLLDRSTGKSELLLVDKNISAIGNSETENVTVLKYISGNKKIILK